MGDPGRKEDAGWIAGARRGDRESCAHLVAHHSRTLIAIAYRYARDWEIARDLTQETWLRVFRHLDRFRDDAAFRPWLLTIHRNGCLSHWRRVKRRPEVRLDSASSARRSTSDDPPQGGRGSAGMPGPEDPGQVADRHAFWEALLEAKRQLSPRQQEVFALVDLEGLRPSEAAAVLEMPAATLRVHLHVARRRLAASLEKKEIRP